MTSTIVTTPSSEDANSYVSRAEADSYFSDRLHAAVWEAATTDSKDKSLLWAAQILDTNIRWKGVVARYSQMRAWPRSGVVDVNRGVEFNPEQIPDFLKYAQCELALSLLSEDITQDPETVGLSSLSVAGAVTLSFSSTEKPLVLPKPVRDLCRNYGAFDDSKAAAVVRVARA